MAAFSFWADVRFFSLELEALFGHDVTMLHHFMVFVIKVYVIVMVFMYFELVVEYIRVYSNRARFYIMVSLLLQVWLLWIPWLMLGWHHRPASAGMHMTIQYLSMIEISYSCLWEYLLNWRKQLLNIGCCDTYLFCCLVGILLQHR